MVHTEGKVLFYHHAPVRVFIYTTVTDIYFVEKKIIRENKSIKMELTLGLLGGQRRRLYQAILNRLFNPKNGLSLAFFKKITIAKIFIKPKCLA